MGLDINVLTTSEALKECLEAMLEVAPDVNFLFPGRAYADVTDEELKVLGEEAWDRMAQRFQNTKIDSRDLAGGLIRLVFVSLSMNAQTTGRTPREVLLLWLDTEQKLAARNN